MNNDSKISRAKRELLYLEAHHHCVYCGRLIPDIKDMTVDHIIPRSIGGTEAFDNLVCSCSGCNAQKADKFVIEFFLTKPEGHLEHYLNRIDQLYRDGNLSYQKQQLLKGLIEEPKQRVINLRFRFWHIHWEISTHRVAFFDY